MLERENIARDSVVYVGDETRDIEACKKPEFLLLR